jgi:hypothetical protein
MDQQLEESAPEQEVSAVEVQPPLESGEPPSRRRRPILNLSVVAIRLLVGASQGLYLVITHAHRAPAPTTGARPTPTATKTLAQRRRAVVSLTAGKASTWLSQVEALSPTDARASVA